MPNDPDRLALTRPDETPKGRPAEHNAIDIGFAGVAQCQTLTLHACPRPNGANKWGWTLNCQESMPKRKIGSRACDGCRIRKVRCTEEPPCTRCFSIGIECTFNRRQATRGPRSLRAKTLKKIQKFQTPQRQSSCGRDSDRGSLADEVSVDGSSTGIQSPPGEEPSGVRIQDREHAGFKRTPVSSLIARLCLYRLRLFPVWPILAAEDIIASLLSNSRDNSTYALANAVCAAVIVQLKLPFEGRTEDNDPATAASMTAECQRTKMLLQDTDGGDGSDARLNTVRIAFFQHIYHENQSPGGTKSLLFLREAITIAQIMGLHRKSFYVLLPPEEQQMRRRILWLLFVTERGVAMLHKLPIVLKWQASFPTLVDKVDVEVDEAHILPAFQKLVDLFWLFDQNGAFDLLTQADDDTEANLEIPLEYLQQRLQEISPDEYETNDVQRADLCVTKCWMQAVVWRASLRQSKAAIFSSERASLLSQPYRIADDFLSHICHCSKTALEAHGPTIELKIFEIASTLTEYIYTMTTGSDRSQGHTNSDIRHVEMLIKLQRLLASSRGGNKTLLSLLCARIAEVESPAGPPELMWNPSIETHDLDKDKARDGPFGMGQQAASTMLASSSYSEVAALTKSNNPLYKHLPLWTTLRLEPNYRMLNDNENESLANVFFTQPSDESWDGWTANTWDMNHCVL